MRRVALRQVKGKRWHTKSFRQRIQRLNEFRLSYMRHKIRLLPRRSSRKGFYGDTIPQRILNNDESGLQIHNFGEPRGRGIVASQAFKKHEPLVEYRGELLSIEEGLHRENMYAESFGSYLYYFKHKGKEYCIDASEETHYLGRLVNHSKLKPNCYTKVMETPERQVLLILFALKNINPGQELLYDYGERRKEIVSLFPWLKM